jgi:hypothetical protein
MSDQPAHPSSPSSCNEEAKHQIYSLPVFNCMHKVLLDFRGVGAKATQMLDNERNCGLILNGLSWVNVLDAVLLL